MVEAGVAADHPRWCRAGRWLLDRRTRCSRGLAPPSARRAARAAGRRSSSRTSITPTWTASSVVLMSLRKIRLPDEEAKTRAIARGLNWVLALQGSDGGWGALATRTTTG
ncbi:MAG: hypothetical protein M0C28_11655 [Candidatus Moduliflexus flocculans]|nr:hypothetical protein [Candidatus Moduliflexus flocculans]